MIEELLKFSPSLGLLKVEVTAAAVRVARNALLCLHVEHVGDVYKGIQEVVAFGKNQASCFPNFQIS